MNEWKTEVREELIYREGSAKHTQNRTETYKRKKRQKIQQRPNTVSLSLSDKEDFVNAERKLYSTRTLTHVYLKSLFFFHILIIIIIILLNEIGFCVYLQFL